ncbi:MAG: zinc ribbon domain-containing protein [Bacillota bacterium]
MIIFGWGHRTVKNFGTASRKYCHHCHNEKPWELLKVTTWFTLFFIPIIPYKKQYLMICPICRSFMELEKQEFEDLQGTASYDYDEYDEMDSPADSTDYDESFDMAGKTETQMNYLKQIREYEEERRNNKASANS